jgi:hypothetical protein
MGRIASLFLVLFLIALTAAHADDAATCRTAASEEAIVLGLPYEGPRIIKELVGRE